MAESKIVKGTAAELIRENTKLRMQLAEERQARADLEDAVLELGELFAEQDDALVELAGLIEEGEE